MLAQAVVVGELHLIREQGVYQVALRRVEEEVLEKICLPLWKEPMVEVIQQILRQQMLDVEEVQLSMKMTMMRMNLTQITTLCLDITLLEDL